VQQNQSVTISYDQREVPAIIDWLMANWDDYVGVSFLFRADPLKTAEDLGYRYLPQQPVTKQVYDEYVAGLKPVSLDGDTGDELVDEDACANGVCPVR
jgi:ribonucleoside-triphosphate reductase